MKTISWPAWCWKTEKLIKISHDTGKYIVALNRQRVDNIWKIAREMQLNIPFPITLDELTKWGNWKWSSISRDWILMDDAHHILQALIPVEIDTAVRYSL